MKKLIFSMLLATSALSSVWAATVRPGFIFLRKPVTAGVIFNLQPPIIPISADEAAFSAFAMDDAIVVSSLSINADVTITVENNLGGIEYATTIHMGAGVEVSIPTADLPAGAYTLYIMYGNEVLVGEFEVE